MKTKLLVLLTLAFILSSALLSRPLWPSLFSYQDPIDPANVLGDSIELPNGDTPKRIEVNLETQHLFAYEADQLVYDFIISSGKWGRTPNGTFTIWAKVRSQTMKGGSPELGTYYNLPNVPYVMFFYNKDYPKQLGFSTHGTYWHSNFGYPMSHGCINLRTSEAKLLYDWASVGTPVTIYGKYIYK